MPFRSSNESESRPSRRAAGAWRSTPLWLFLCILASPISAGEQVEIVVSLDESGHYAVDDLLQQFNRELKTNYPVDAHRGEKRLFSTAERIALTLASEAGVLDARIGPDRITMRLLKPDSPAARREARQQLRKWFGISERRWAPSQGLHVPKALDVTRPVLLLIHGLEAGPADFARFQEACRATEIQLLTFDYPNDGPLADAGDRLSEELKTLARRHPGLRLAVVGHSMGGLIGRYVVETPGKNPDCVTDLFLLGTPHQGSRLAGEYAFAELVIQIAPAGLRGLGSSMTDGLGEAADDLSPGSEFLTLLNAQPRPAGVRYHVGIGMRSFLTAEQQAAVVDDLQRIAEARKVALPQRQEWFELLSADELTDGRGDGAVSVASARLKGVASERFFPLNHNELLSLPGAKPASSAVFQWIVSQMAWRRSAGEVND